jgi:murein DD-endopeptidase MepM/ murein hydrolase activator NlpD
MLKRITIIFGVVFAFGFLYYLLAAIAGTVSSDSLFLVPSIIPPASVGGANQGLTAVNFSQFAKGGIGWNYITQGYGDTPYSYMYIDHWHNGIDIGADYGAPIYSPINGAMVVATGDQDNFCPHQAFGRFIVLADPTHNVVLLFAHLNQILVAPGQALDKSAEIGTVGTSGLETGPHLHFSVFESAGFSMAPAHGCGPYPQGHDINPIPYLESVEGQ